MKYINTKIHISLTLILNNIFQGETSRHVRHLDNILLTISQSFQRFVGTMSYQILRAVDIAIIQAIDII